MQGFKKTTRMARSAAAAALMTLAMGVVGAHAYPMYDDGTTPIGFGAGCVDCHADFQSVGALHSQHVNNFDITATLIIDVNCNVCHTSGGGTTPVYTMGSNLAEGGGLGCAGCHGQDYGENAFTAPYTGLPKASGWGLRRVHQAAGVMTCQGCHGVGPAPLDETVAPPYYPMGVSKLGNPCFSGQEDLSYDDPPNHSMDFVGLDNDGNGFADYPADPNCGVPTTTTTTTSTTTTTLPATCGVSPVGVCTASLKAKFSVNEKTAGKQKMKFQLTKIVPAVAQGEFGDPVGGGGTSYALCVYNAASALVVSYEVARAGDSCAGDPCWEDFKGIGYAYVDKDVSADGISKIQLAGGDAEKGKVKMLGNNGSSTLPTGIAALLNGETSVTAQLITNTGECFGMALPTVKKADGIQFNAVAP